MAWPIRQLLAGAFPLLVRPPQKAAGGPAAPRRRQQRSGAAARRLRELAHADTAVIAGEAREAMGPPARLLRCEALHGAADADQVGLLGGEICRVASESPRRRDSDKRRRQELIEADQEVDEAWIAEAKEEIINSDSMSAMFRAAKVNIDEDWLGDVDELPGNIYRIAALGTLTAELFDKDADLVEMFSRLVPIVGFAMIFLIQICGPPLLIASVYFDWGVVQDSDIQWGDWEPSFSDWAAIKATKVLSTLLLLFFSVNGLYVILQEKQSWLKIYKTFRYLKHNTPNMEIRGEPFLILGPIVNSWVTVLTCIASFVILGSSFSPRNVLFDALGLLFLYNLDDIGGDLGFASTDDWDGLRLGWIYREIVEGKYRKIGTDGQHDSQAALEEQYWKEEDIGRTGRMVLRLYDTVSMLLLVAALVMPVVAFVTPFIKIIPEGFE